MDHEGPAKPLYLREKFFAHFVASELLYAAIW
jgi:hypothetical protein